MKIPLNFQLLLRNYNFPLKQCCTSDVWSHIPNFKEILLYPVEFVPGIHRENKKWCLKFDFATTCLIFYHLTSKKWHSVLHSMNFTRSDSVDKFILKVINYRHKVGFFASDHDHF